MLRQAPNDGVALVMRNTQFRWLWGGSVLSGCGVWIQNLAVGWFVADLPRGAFLLGVMGFLGLAPVLLVSLVGGVIADCRDRRSVAITCQVTLMTGAIALAVVSYFGTLQFWHLAMATLLSGLASAFNSPAYQALIADSVTREDLPHAVALNSVGFNTSRIVGHAIAGIVVLWVGLTGCFLLNAVSYGALLSALAKTRTASGHRNRDQAGFLTRIREAVSHVRQSPALVWRISLVASISFLGLPYFFLLPLFGRSVLHTNARDLGLLMASVSVGGLIGGLTVARVTLLIGHGSTIRWFGRAFWVLLLGFAFCADWHLGVILLTALGFALVVTLTAVNTSLQLATPPEARGRVMSILSLATNGLAPIGGLLAGSFAASAGPRAAVLGMASIGLLATLFLTMIDQCEAGDVAAGLDRINPLEKGACE